ncbi:UxaA family hydrolase [Phyllobacterium sp. UNC302MFCol5.2]|uniref:UxaA family hydrolase n=1 Tax=Phyllobacterium sp. UNC302MFCol5.2 TaxID=1449065 RepID=UPI00056430FA|nr:UxaA family hydrolase [Phyllobacterium sp. UNC302MFCol5.2]
MSAQEKFSTGWNAVVIDHQDNIAVALDDLSGNARVKRGDEEFSVELHENIPSGHKLAIRSIAKGQPVLKYGQPIGTAASDIAIGTHVHVHNLKSGRASL